MVRDVDVVMRLCCWLTSGCLFTAPSGPAPEKARANKKLDFDLLDAVNIGETASDREAKHRLAVTPRSAMFLTTSAAGQWHGKSLEELRREEAMVEERKNAERADNIKQVAMYFNVWVKPLNNKGRVSGRASCRRHTVCGTGLHLSLPPDGPHDQDHHASHPTLHCRCTGDER